MRKPYEIYSKYKFLQKKYLERDIQAKMCKIHTNCKYNTVLHLKQKRDAPSSLNCASELSPCKPFISESLGGGQQWRAHRCSRCGRELAIMTLALAIGKLIPKFKRTCPSDGGAGKAWHQ